MEENLHSSETNKNNKNKKHDAKTVLQQCLEPLKCPEDGECFLPSLQGNAEIFSNILKIS